jgi:hypothetical protein
MGVAIMSAAHATGSESADVFMTISYAGKVLLVINDVMIVRAGKMGIQKRRYNNRGPLSFNWVI